MPDRELSRVAPPPALPVALLNRPHRTAWANLGLWSSGADYRAAATALATRVGEAAGLSPETRLLDVGVGAGEQLVHWAEHFGVRRVTALEIVPEMAERARRRVAAAGLTDRVEVRAGDGADLLRALDPPPADPRRPARGHRREGGPRFDAVVALDCAYHFDPREGFVGGAAAALRPGGRLALTDLVVDRPPGPRLIRRARRAGIPDGNLVGATEYCRRIAAAGFTEVRAVDLTGPVLVGFVRWALGRAPGLLLRGGSDGLRVVGTALALVGARRSGLRCLLVSAVRARI